MQPPRVQYMRRARSPTSFWPEPKKLSSGHSLNQPCFVVSGGRLGLSTRGATALRIRFLYDEDGPEEKWEARACRSFLEVWTFPLHIQKVKPDEPDAPFSATRTLDEQVQDASSVAGVLQLCVL